MSWLAFTKFMAGEIAEAVVGRVFVRLAERGVIENLLDEFVDGKAVIQHHHADVNEFGGVFADHADAEELLIGAGEDELEHAGGVASDVSAGVVFIKRAAHDVFDFLFLAGFFVLARRRNLRDGVNAHGKQRSDALFVLQLESVANSDAALFQGSGGQSGKADNVAGGINMWNGGAIVFVHGDVAAVIEGKIGFLERQAVDRGAAAGGEKSGVGLQRLAALHGETDTRSRIFGFDGAFVEPEMHAEGLEAVAEAVGNFVVEKRKKTVAAVDKSNLDSEGFENGSVFATDHAAADDGEAFRNAVHLEKSVGIESMNIVEGDLRGAVGLRPGGDEDDFTLQPARAVGALDDQGVGIFERGLAADEFDVMEGKIFQDAPALHFDNLALVMHEVVHREVFLQRVIDAVEAALLQAGKIECGFAQGLAGNGPRVDAAPAHVFGALDDGDALAEVGGLGAGFFTGRTAADGDEIEIVTRNHKSSTNASRHTLPRVIPPEQQGF